MRLSPFPPSAIPIFKTDPSFAALWYPQNQAATRLAHLRLEPAFETYLSTLRKASWFEDEMEGSQRFKEREEEAARAWVKLKMDENS